MKTKVIRALLLMSLLLAGNAVAMADGFVLPQWTLSNAPSYNNGYVDTSGAPSSITLYGGNFQYLNPNSTLAQYGGHTDYTRIMAEDSVVTFDWAYQSFDNWQRSSYDPAFYLIAGDVVVLMNNALTSGSGSVSALVHSGDVFGFRIVTTDGCCGRASLTVSDYTEREPIQSQDLPTVPEPGTLALLGSGGLAIAVGLRRRIAG